jgi:CheY-like chemotaxis protein
VISKYIPFSDRLFMTVIAHPGFSRHLDQHVVFLRRYARALTGSRSNGDQLAEKVRSEVLANPVLESPRLALFQKFHKFWTGSSAGHNEEVPTLSREVFLLHSLEDFGFSQIQEILQIPYRSVKTLYHQGLSDLQKIRPSRILLVEDETLIAMDMSNVINDMGHSVIGVARTRAEAVSLARDGKPDLITCDIHLADGSSGIDAIADILEFSPKVAVIFLTGFPEELLTGTFSEPAFVIDKPYREKQVQSAIAQALELRAS